MTPEAPRWSKAKLAFGYGYMRFTELYVSLFLAGLASLGIVILYVWATSRGLVPHLTFEKDRSAFRRALLALFAAAYLYSLWRLAGPDWVIGRRLRRVAEALGMELTERADGVVTDWVWARFTTADDLITSRLRGRCWALSSRAQPSMLLAVSHIPKVLGFSRVGGDKQRETMAVMLFWQVNDRHAELPASATEQLTATGFKSDRIPDGLFVHEIKRCGRRRGQRATDQVDAPRIAALWGLCTGTSPTLIR